MQVRLESCNGLFDFQAGDESTITVNASVKAHATINRNLFGKFTEHLGRNIYNGMSAQVLQNPSFADWSFYRSVTKAGDRLRNQGFPIDDVVDAYEKGTAPYWVPVGKAACLVDWRKPYHGHTCQRVATEGNGDGIAQPTWLPAHRTDGYVLNVQVRGTAQGLRASISRPGEAGVLCDADLGNVDSEAWAERSVALTLPEGAVRAGEVVEFRMTAGASSRFWIGLAFLYPDDHRDGFDPEVVRLLTDSKLPLYRFPGGNFVSGYHWRDGVGPLPERPLLMNPAWDLPEPNFIGTDDHLRFCEAVGCEPMICVNAGGGTPKEAAEWVEYCNGGADTDMGRLRAQNGREEPYNVRIWEIGNELYGGWQIGSCTPEEYAERYEAYRTAMLEVDPSLAIIGNGQNTRWNGPILERKADIVRSLSTHRLIGGGSRDETDAEGVWNALMAYVTHTDVEIGELTEQAKANGCDLKTAITELQVFTNRQNLPNNGTIAEALLLAGTIHSAFRLGDTVELITHSALINHGGGLRKQHEIVFANPVHWVSHLYGNLPTARLVRTRWQCPTFDASMKGIGDYEDAPLLDAAAALSESGDRLFLMVMNRSAKETVTAPVRVDGFDVGEATVETVSSEGLLETNTWDAPDRIGVARESLTVDGGSLSLTLAPRSVNVVTLA